MSEQSGNYLALKVETDNEDDVITVEVLNGTLGHPVTLDSDRNIVLRIANNITQQIRIVATRDDTTSTKTYSLIGLTLEAAPAANP